jgi:hypothetical protein
MGRIRSVCARIIAVGVKSSDSSPSGPERESTR